MGRRAVAHTRPLNLRGGGCRRCQLGLDLHGACLGAFKRSYELRVVEDVACVEIKNDVGSRCERRSRMLRCLSSSSYT